MLEIDGQFLESAYVANRGVLVRRLTAMTRDAAAAEDIAQEAFLRLVREVEAGRTPDDPAAWLHRVAANLVASRGRHLTVVDRRSGRLEPPSAPDDPEDMAVQGELDAAVRSALADLPEDDRRALLLAAHGYRGPEIAANLGRSCGATRTLLCRARARLRERLTLAGFAPA